jgi:hypothetical protein
VTASWKVAGGDAFVVDDPGGLVGLEQLSEVDFRVTTGFEFKDLEVRERLITSIVRKRNPSRTAAQATTMVDAACTYTVKGKPPQDVETDLASIPSFMRWFVNTYGLHTLAALLHDNLIVGEPNEGVLESDTLSDRFFREMLRCCGVRFLKRWIMWAAVALRTRWAAGGIRQASVLIWGLLAAAGITAFVWSLGAFAGWPHLLAPWWMLVIAVAMPFVAAPLWGRQYGASLVAAVAALWILPPALLGVIGYLVYRALEGVADHVLRLR